MIQYFPLLAERDSTQKYRENINNRAKKEVKIGGIPKEEADAFLVIGGDGYLLEAMRKYYHYQKPFFGLHAGTLGFLLNHMSLDDLPQSLEALQLIDSELLHITCTLASGATEEAVCVNDCIIGGEMIDYFSLSVAKGSESEVFDGSGLVVSSSIGSTGYALQNGAPIMPLSSSLWCMTGLATRPFHYSFVEPEKISISIKGRSPCTVGCDGHGHVIRDVVSLVIKPSSQKVSLAFCPHQDFQKRRLLMAAKKLGV